MLKLSSMKNHNFSFLVILCGFTVHLQSATPGFYKDLFMDGGKELTSRTSLPAAVSLDLSMEYLATDDQTIQTKIMIGNDYDENGILLYPDGAPRFRLIYTNGGSATGHGNSLGEQGRQRVRSFYYNGGSYSGSCAGAFIVSVSYMVSGTYEPYYHIWRPPIPDISFLKTLPCCIIIISAEIIISVLFTIMAAVLPAKMLIFRPEQKSCCDMIIPHWTCTGSPAAGPIKKMTGAVDWW